MTDNPRETQMLDAVVTLVDSLLDDFDLVDLLTDLTASCASCSTSRPPGFFLPTRWGSCACWRRPPSRPANWSSFSCRPTKARVSTATRPASRYRSPTSAPPHAVAAVLPAAVDAGFASVHAVPMRAAGIVLGALGLFGTRPGELNEPDLLVGQTLAHIACVAILQEHPPTPETVMPRLRSALAGRVVVEQAKGFLRESLDVSVEEAFRLLRTYARARVSTSPTSPGA